MGSFEVAPASRQVATFLIGPIRFAVDLAATEAVLPMVAIAPLPGAPLPVLGAIDVGGRIVPVVDLRQRLGLPPGGYGIAAHLLLVRSARRTVALATDEVQGVAKVPLSAIAPGPVVFPGLSPVDGLAALPEGILLICDLDAFLTPDEERLVDDALGDPR